MLFYCGKTRKLSRQKCVLRPPLKLYSLSSGFKRKALVAFVSFVYLTGKVLNIHHVIKPKSPARKSWVLAFSLMLFEYVNTQLDGCMSESEKGILCGSALVPSRVRLKDSRFYRSLWRIVLGSFPHCSY